MSGDEFLEEIRKTTKEEQEKYEKYNKDFLSSWADRAVVYKKVSSLVQPLFEKILDTVVDYCLEINKKEKSNELMEDTIDKMIDVLNDYCDATDKIEEEKEKETMSSFYKEVENVDINTNKDPKKFYLSNESINEINKGDVDISFDILSETNINGLFGNETKIDNCTKQSYNESISDYTINKDMNGSFMYINLFGYLKKTSETEDNSSCDEWSELILHGLPENKLRIIERRDDKNNNIIDFGNIINHIFVDSDIYIIPEEKPSDNIYLDKIKSLEQLKEYFKSQGKDVSSLDESVKYNKGISDRFERRNKSEEYKPTQKELSTIDDIKQTAEKTEQIIKDNAESEL